MPESVIVFESEGVNWLRKLLVFQEHDLNLWLELVEEFWKLSQRNSCCAFGK